MKKLFVVGLVSFILTPIAVNADTACFLYGGGGSLTLDFSVLPRNVIPFRHHGKS